jgi:hypothetical protein
MPDGFVLFDVLYEDGTQTSNRKVPATELGGLDGDLPARTFVEAQDREIGVVSGRPRGRIKPLTQDAKMRPHLMTTVVERSGIFFVLNGHHLLDAADMLTGISVSPSTD